MVAELVQVGVEESELEPAAEVEVLLPAALFQVELQAAVRPE